MKTRAASLMFALLLLPGCHKAGSSVSDSGIDGVLVSRQTAGGMIGVAYEPSPGTVQVMKKHRGDGDRVMEEVHTDSHGHFEIPLPPGVYVLVAPSQTADVGEFHTYRTMVTVRAHHVVQVEVRTWAELP